MSQCELSIVIPGFNEEAVIEENLRTIWSVVKKLNVSSELIFVNDGSTDNTHSVVQDLQKEINELRVVSYPDNKGRGFALKTGIEVASGEYILTIESDMNYGRTIIPELFEKINESKWDIVVASPYMKGGKTKNVPAKRLFLSKWGNKILSASIGNLVHTLSGMTRIYKRTCVQSILINSNDKEIHLEILSKALALGYQITEIPATLAWPEKKIQKAGKRKSSFTAIKYITSHINFTLFERPILFFGLLGLVILLCGLGLGVYIIVLRFSGDLNPVRPLMSLVVLMILGGIFVISFGLIGMQINNLRSEIYRLQKEIKEKT